MSGKLSGTALAAAITKAAEAAISEAVQGRAERLAAAVDASRSALSPLLWGRTGEGGDTQPSPDHRDGSPAAPLSDPSPQGGRGTDGLRLVIAKKSGRGSTTLTFSAPNLFAREFGALGAPADPVLAPAIDALRRRPA
jgi:hypothetical protein